MSVWRGITFSFTLIVILASHEFGHYFMAKRYAVDVTLPYFIPAPSFIGTFGAFIKMKSPILDRRMLLDIGAAGPVAGMVVALPVLLVGLMLSDVRPASSGTGTNLGSSLLFSLLSWIAHGSLPTEMDIVLHPIAFSGWIGLLVTCLNLLLILLGLTSWTGWLVWAAILYLMGLDHPPVVYEWIPLDRRRLIIGWAATGIFVMTFTPAPF